MIIVYGYYWRRLIKGQAVERRVARVFRVAIRRQSVSRCHVTALFSGPVFVVLIRETLSRRGCSGPRVSRDHDVILHRRGLDCGCFAKAYIRV